MNCKVSNLFCILRLLPAFGYGQSDAYSLQRILQRYIETYGGFRDAEALSSLSIEGTIEQNGQNYAFLVYQKRPYSMRYRISNGANSVITGFNGSSGWIRVETNGEVMIKSLNGSEYDSLRKMARFDSPLFRHLEKSQVQINQLERSIWEGKSVYVIEVREPGDLVSHYYLDAKSAYLLRRDELNAQGGIAFQTLYRDYREVEGFPLAHEIETRVGEQTVSLANVHTIEVNHGLLSFFFEKPDR